jgi:hypothetical protein
MSDQPEPDRIIGTVTKNTRESVAVAMRTFKGHRFIDVRIVAALADGNTVPTGKGVALRADVVPELVTLLRRAHAMALEAGWCVDDGA